MTHYWWSMIVSENQCGAGRAAPRARQCGIEAKQREERPRYSSPSISRMFCTAAPDAPLPRLSSRATRTACRCSLAREDVELQHVGLVERLRLQPPAFRRVVLERHDRDILAAGVALRQRRVQIGAARLARQRVEMQRHRHQHALPVVADRRHEDRPPRELGVELASRADACARSRGRKARRTAPCRLRSSAIIDLPPPV